MKRETYFQTFIVSAPRIEDMHKGMGILAGALLVAAACIAGCLTMDVHVKVNPDASVGSYTLTMNMTSAAYSLLTQSAHASGYQNLREQLSAEGAGSGAMKYSEQWGPDSVTVTLEADGPIGSVNQSGWSITKSDNFMVYEDSRLVSGRVHDAAAGEDRYSTAMISALTVHYYLEMPGKIVESNANTITDNKAEWHLSGLDAFSTKIYARSEVPLLPSIPGFAGTSAILGVLAVAAIVLRRRA